MIKCFSYLFVSAKKSYFLRSLRSFSDSKTNIPLGQIGKKVKSILDAGQVKYTHEKGTPFDTLKKEFQIFHLDDPSQRKLILVSDKKKVAQQNDTSLDTLKDKCRVFHLGDPLQTEIPLFETLTAFEFPSNIFTNITKIIGPNILIARDFYERLLTEIRKEEKCCLIGNPGTQKSMFQYYFIFRIMNFDKLGPLPPDSFGNTDPPNIIIRQEGLTYFIHILEESVTFELDKLNDKVLNLFDGKETLYLFEPDQEKREPYYLHGIPTLATCSPDDSRYKEFIKNGGVKLYMPCLTQNELLSIGKYLVKVGELTTEMKELYSDEKITERFKEYGGIYRNVLPNNIYHVRQLKLQKSAAISDLTKETLYKLLSSANIEDPYISHLLAQFDVKKEGEYEFESYTMQFVSENIPLELKKKLQDLSTYELRHLLRRSDETGYLEASAREMYESYIVKCHLQGFDASTRSNNTNSEWISNYVINENNKLMVSEGKPPIFDNMVKDILYYSLNPIFPLSDVMYKTTDSNGKSELCVVQVSRERKNRTITKKAANQFLESLGLKDFSDVKYYYYGHPTRVSKVKINLKGSHKFKDIQIVKVPEDYIFLKIRK